MSRPASSAELLIIGSGLMGAAVAQQVTSTRPQTRVVMVDAGPPIVAERGGHLHNSDDPEVLDAYTYLMQGGFGVPARYVGATWDPSLGETLASARPGMYFMSAFGERADEMPAAALSWNVGGMGAHWSAATPWPYGDEVYAHGMSTAWARDLATAQRLLHVTAAPFPPGPTSKAVLDAAELAIGPASDPSRRMQSMPMAGRQHPGRRMLRTGPGDIFPRMRRPDADDFSLLTGTLAVGLLHDGERVNGVRLRNVRTGEEFDQTVDRVVVAADTIRTPQLLFASGIRPWALGRHLNEHGFLSARVIVDLDRFGSSLADVPEAAAGEILIGSYWQPHSGSEQPFHGIFTDHLYSDEEGTRLAYAMAFQLYTPTETQAANRLEFSDHAVDALGMPQIQIDFKLSDKDRTVLDRGRELQARIGSALGDFDLERDASMLDAGSSLHFTGTTRCGPHDDGSSVTDVDGLVWGFQNLWLTGGSVVPTPVVCNSTLTATVTAVRSARSVSSSF